MQSLAGPTTRGVVTARSDFDVAGGPWEPYHTRVRSVLVVIFVCARLLASSAAEACEPATPFELFDRADRVVVGTITTPAAKRAHEPLAPVVVTVETVLKGAANATVMVVPEQ